MVSQAGQTDAVLVLGCPLLPSTRRRQQPAYMVVTVYQKDRTLDAQTAVQRFGALRPHVAAEHAMDTHFWDEDLFFMLEDPESTYSIAVEAHI